MQNRSLRLALSLSGAFATLLSPASALDAISPQPVTDINAAGDSTPTQITYADDHLYFVAHDAKGRSGLYVKSLLKKKSRLADPVLDRKPLKIKSLTNTKSVTSLTDNFVVAPNTYPPNHHVLYFHVIGDGLYTTRGTAKTTKRLLKWNDQSNGSYIDPQVTAFQGSGKSKAAGVVFTGFKAATGFEPFITTGKGASLIKDIVPGSGSSFPYDYCARPSGDFQDQIIFGAFDPTDLYQLHRYRQNDNQHGFTVEHFNVARTSSSDDNLNTYPFGMTLAGNDVVYSAGNHASDNGRDVGFLDTTNGLASVLADTANVTPINFETGSVSSAAFFSGYNSTFTARVFWAAFGGGSPFAEIYDDTVVGTNPREIKTFPRPEIADSTATYTTYVIADEGGSPRLYRKFSSQDSIKIKTNTNAELVVSDYNAVTDPDGNGHIFIIGHTGSDADSLWVLDNSVGGTIDEQAEPVLTAQGHPILNPSQLANATHLVGATAYSRLYFSCSGVGTEFEFKLDSHGQPTSTTRGEEVWTLQVAD